MDLATVWGAAQDQLRDELGWLRTEGWLDLVRLRALHRGTPWLEADTREARELALVHESALRAALAEVLASPVPRLKFTVPRRMRARGRRASGSGSNSTSDSVHMETERVNERHQLSSFLTGPANEIPLRFARAAVDSPGRWNPLVFYGGSGNGKTHLLQGIANDFRRRYPARRVVYSSSERFARLYSVTARRRQAVRFRDHFRNADLLVLDDVQDLVGKQATERELVFTLDHLTLSKRQVVVATSEPPKRLSYVEPGLQGRLLNGLVVPLKKPDRATRQEIIRARAAAAHLRLIEPVYELLLAGFGSSMRELLSALTRLEAYQRHVGPNLDLATVRHLLSDMLQDRVRPATLDGICEFVAERTQTSVEAQRGRSRKPNAVRARQLGMALARDMTPLTLREIGAYFGSRSCASVHAAQAKIEELRGEADREIVEAWEAAHGLFTRVER